VTPLVFLLIAGILVTGVSESRQGKWSGFAVVVLAAVGIVGLTVGRAAGGLP